MFSTAKAFASTKKGFNEIKEEVKKNREQKDSGLVSILEDALTYGAMALKQQQETENSVKQEVDQQRDKTLADALTAVKAAVALGFPAPSFVGGKYYPAYISTSNYGSDEDLEHYPEFLGDYPTKELAEKAIVSYIKEKMNTKTPTGRQILGPDGEVYWTARGTDSWVAGEKASDEEIVRSYFSSASREGFLIQEKELVGELKPEVRFGERSNATVLERDFTYYC